MNADGGMMHGGENDVNGVTLSGETISKISEFASNHSNGEDAEKLRDQLSNWLREII